MSTTALLFCLALLPAPTQGADAPRSAKGNTWFPFVIPWDDAAAGPTNVGALHPAPAGGAGFLTTRDGHFYTPAGKRVRFLGVNFSLSANFPEKADAIKVAAHLRKFGVNLVRLHLMDYYHAPKGIFDPRYKDKQHLDAGQLDKLDHLVYQLKRHGIYVNINLHVARAFTVADGFPETEKLPHLGAVVNYFEPRMIELQKKYASDLLTHFNPYTKTKYADEPAVAIVELTNENTLVGAAWSSQLDTLPAYYRDALQQQWNTWLKKRYGTTAALAVAWKATAPGKAENLLGNAGFTDGTKSWKLEVQKVADATPEVTAVTPPSGVAGKVLRLWVNKSGDQSWHVQMHQGGLNLDEGQSYTVSFWARSSGKRNLGVNATLDQPDWHNVGLSERVVLDKDWHAFRFTFTANKTVKGHGRLGFMLGGDSNTVELAGVTVVAGGGNLIPAGAKVENGTIPPGKAQDTLAGRDWLAFLMDVEAAFNTTLRDYLRKDLGVRASIMCSQASYGGLAGAFRERQSDLVDMHSYWQHPVFPRRSWDPADWRIANTPMVKEKNGAMFSRLSRYRLAGQPFTVSEYNHPAPSDYQAECLPLLAAIAAVQDWDAIYLFDYNNDRDTWNSNRIRGYFAIDSNPAKMALLPAAALMFVRGDVPAAKEEVQLRVPVDSVVGLVAARKDPAQLWEAAASPAYDCNNRRLSVAFTPGGGPVTLHPQGKAMAAVGTGALRWTGAGTDRALITVDAPRSGAVVGYIGGQQTKLSSWQVQAPAGGFGFAAVTLSALDGLPIDKSGSLLLTAVGRVENEGMGWNAERTSVGKNWGSGPTQAEGVTATVSIATPAAAAKVYALDAAGQRKYVVPVTVAGGRLTFTINPTFRALWYEVVPELVRPAGGP
jgi:hypothetical protein